MSNKTISINPSLFSIGGTKKKKEKKQKTNVTPLISPNILKNKLLKRIKEHKQRETQNLENNTKKTPKNNETTDLKKTNNDIFSDEFSESINYLQTLSKQKKNINEKNNNEKIKQKQRESLEKKTLKNFKWNDNDNQEIYVNTELPEELKIYTENTNTNTNTNTNDQLPYGILKGGSKPTYRTWRKTQRNNVVTNPNSALTIQGGEINKEKSEREKRLNNLREKLKQKQIENEVEQTTYIVENQNLIQKPNDNIVISDNEIKIVVPEMKNESNINNNINDNDIIAVKKITKKTIKRKYTLGKSKIKKCVSVLVKDRNTRKQILHAQKELKKKPINDIKNYLREHNLIKVGSNAPNDVVRKLYESAMLAGEITNSNTEILLHNFSKDDKEL